MTQGIPAVLSILTVSSGQPIACLVQHMLAGFTEGREEVHPAAAGKLALRTGSGTSYIWRNSATAQLMARSRGALPTGEAQMSLHLMFSSVSLWFQILQ